MTSSAPTAFTWDHNGNTVGDSWLGNVGTYGWHTENRLVKVVHANGAIETNTYYAHGLRESYTGTGASGRDRFIYDGVNVLLEKLPGGTFAIYTQQPESCGNAPMIGGPFRRESVPQDGASAATMSAVCSADEGESP